MAKSKFPGGRRTGNPAAGAKPQMAGASASASTVTVDAPVAKPRTSPAQFASQVRAEARKIVWPSRKETWITSVMVFIMVLLAAAFFWIVDTGLGFASRYILALGQ
ncbi:MAG: preprotein translocase subunit SecE [Brevundimonas subvibrioides]|uniref:Protein translocase subunit SecE n=1 Tax=Brevundimonas subvibrioides TaxID=74313 RepID=A0A258HD32_9CAUL|nr:preprotein translocase subunit SecE [Brevundimonas subvibrioides]OYX54881.1 MAG: preprotein translocase subunit SecE [Brevundimonas subvibrioides]